jgi:hypothetical protein
LGSTESIAAIIGDQPSQEMRAEILDLREKGHEDDSRWDSVSHLGRLQLPEFAAGDAGRMHLAGLFRQNRCRHTAGDHSSAIHAGSGDQSEAKKGRQDDCAIVG